MTIKSMETMRQDAARIFEAGIRAVEAGEAVRRHCRLEDDRFWVDDTAIDLKTIRNILVIGAGKANAFMAESLEEILGDRITQGWINVPYGYTRRLQRIHQQESGHPVPDSAGEFGAAKMMAMARSAHSEDLVICLISGGGSALAPLPAPGLTLSDKQDTIRELLSCGASIHEINTIRKHISAFKGGNLAVASFPARLVSIMISDVIGDVPDIIASGPTVPDDGTFRDCLEIIRQYRLEDRLPHPVMAHLLAGMRGEIHETPKSGDPTFQQTTYHIIASNILSIFAAREQAAALGYHPLVLSSTISGETREIAGMHAAIAREIRQTGNPITPPACLLSGGETTVHIQGNGKGGRNQEFVLATVPELATIPETVVWSAGTDGRDGPTDAAGAVADTRTLSRARKLGLNPRDFLENNDSYGFFSRMNDLIPEKPTGTNVMDLRIILVGYNKESA